MTAVPLAQGQVLVREIRAVAVVVARAVRALPVNSSVHP